MELKQTIAQGRFAVLAELIPPKGVDPSGVVTCAQSLKEQIDAFVVSDQRDANMSMSAWGCCAQLASHGIPNVMQVSLRDRNRLALQGDLLAAHSLGIRSVLVHRGGEISQGDHPDSTAVYDLDPGAALSIISDLNQGQDSMGNALAGGTDFYFGTTFRLWSAGRLGGLNQELDRLCASGVQFFITPPIYDVESIEHLSEKLSGRGLTILPTVAVLKSVAEAQALRVHAKQVHMPDGLLSRLKKAKESQEECLAIGRELAQGIKEAGFSGVLLSAPGWEDRLAELAEGLNQ